MAKNHDFCFVLLVSDLCFAGLRSLYVTLRTSPFVVENLGKLHTMSLTAQSITLFYALLLEVQHLSSETVCMDRSGETCKRDISDIVMDNLLTLLQVSVFVLPCGLILRDRGLFSAVARTFDRICKRAQVSLRIKAVAKTKKHRWPEEVTVRAGQIAFSKRSETAGERPEHIKWKEVGSACGTLGKASLSKQRQNDIEIHVEEIEEELMSMAGLTPSCETELRNLVDPFTAKWREDTSPGAGCREEDFAAQKEAEGKALRRDLAAKRDGDKLAAERNAIAVEHEKLTVTLAQSTRSRLSRQSTLHSSEHSATPSIVRIAEAKEGVEFERSDGETTSIRIRRDVEISTVTEDLQPVVGQASTRSSPIDVWNNTNILARSLGNAMCGNSCLGIDAHATHWFFYRNIHFTCVYFFCMNQFHAI